MKTAYLAGLFAGASLSLVYFLQASYSSSMNLISNALFLLTSAAALGSASFALKKYWRNLRDRYSQIWLFFAAGLLIWFVCRLSLSFYTLSLNDEIPFPSVVDAIWLAGYVPIFAAMHSYLRSFGFSLSRIRYSAFAVAISLVLLACYVLLVPSVVATNEKNIPTVLSLVYLGLDLSLLSFSMIGLFVFVNGRIGVAWAFISGAFFLNAVGDMLFSYALQSNSYYSGHTLELLFHVSYILCAFAFYAHMKEL
ncbi:MAG TPA: hypothetical protein VJ249_05225 [Candidatus Bathyarchaeia archaeon]|nr:hypothetical protein [Candidatus Bathyarchaeia archaeon]